MRSTVIFSEKATPASITEFHDILSNDLVSIKEKWSFEFKTYRLTVKNLPQGSSKLMHVITFTNRDNQSVIIKNNSAIITSSATEAVQSSLTLNGCSTGTLDTFDNLLVSKLSNLWTQRQNIKGDFGSTFKTTELTVRATNVFSYGGFKGLLIELECEDGVSDKDFDQRVMKIRHLLDEMSIGEYRVCSSSMDPKNYNFICDLAFQYVKVLEV
ncbi:LAQU0S11e02608g1_1 [Lachancea quebecensis]|uniref:Mediator of RNA polymerase II transcription subunit 20 n=1 Tax=Lachancea quebecensis TaxID=1654605 RepID=A0A0P1KV13_9SACH|nr:LAQU0S11e02608g1_1 [Lachancea quebecensis]